MKNEYRRAVLKALEKTKGQKPGILTEADIQHLPDAVKKYLMLTGVVGKEKIINFRAEFRGGIRSGPGEKYMSLRSVQYNFIEDPERLFHIAAKKMGIPVLGNHIYRDQKATMMIKILGLFTVSDAKGWQMDQGELVNFISNDRFETKDGKNYFNFPWSTPVLSYTDINGYHLPSGAKLIYKHPDEDFCYGEFRLVSLEYNCRDYR